MADGGRSINVAVALQVPGRHCALRTPSSSSSSSALLLVETIFIKAGGSRILNQRPLVVDPQYIHICIISKVSTVSCMSVSQ